MIRIGVVGTGDIAQGHVERLCQMEGVACEAFCDIIPERAQAMAAAHGGRAYAHFRQMYREEPLDAVLVCVTPDAHGEIEIEACRRGLHLLIEKPVALDLDTAHSVGEAVASSGVITLVGYKYRYDDHVNRAREMLAGKTPALVVGWYWSGLPPTAWWRQMARSGGQFLEQTTHITDMARYLVGDVIEVWARYDRRRPDDPELGDIPDVGVVGLQFESGVLGEITNTCLHSGSWHSGLRVFAPEISISIEGSVLRWEGPDGSGEYRQERDGYGEEDRVFVEAVATGDRSRIVSDYFQGLESLKVALGANMSAAGGGTPVNLAEI